MKSAGSAEVFLGLHDFVKVFRGPLRFLGSAEICRAVSGSAGACMGSPGSAEVY